MKKIQQQFQVSYSFPVVFTRDVFNISNSALSGILNRTGQKNRILIVIDSNVLNAFPDLIEKMERYARHHNEIIEFVSSPFVMHGGETCKKDTTEVGKIHSLIEKHNICRHSCILAIGGGAVLDAAGYAAATAHRGIRLIRMPTTTLSQNDAGVGVKNAINAFGRKNFLGTFAPPYAIINDFDFLNTLPERALRAGISEAVKVALIKDRAFFDLLYNNRHELASFAPEVMEKMIIRCAELHIDHIGSGGDPFEQGSARPLDFGHWSAHKLEELTNGELQHGEAVAIGVALDSIYSHHKGLITEIDLQKILSTLEGIGFDLYNWALNWMDIPKALKDFQEHLGGRLSIPLLNGIGNKTEANMIDTDMMKKCINILAERSGRKEGKDGIEEKTDDGERGAGSLLS